MENHADDCGCARCLRDQACVHRYWSWYYADHAIWDDPRYAAKAAAYRIKAEAYERQARAQEAREARDEGQNDRASTPDPDL